MNNLVLMKVLDGARHLSDYMTGILLCEAALHTGRYSHSMGDMSANESVTATLWS